MTAGRVRRLRARDAAGRQAARSASARAWSRSRPYTQGVRAAFETIVLDVHGGRSRAYRSFVDARTGEVLYRSNEVKQAGRRPAERRHVLRQHRLHGCGDPQPVDVTGAFSDLRRRDREPPVRRHRPQADRPRRQRRRVVRHRARARRPSTTPATARKVADGTYQHRRLRVQRPDGPGQRRQLRLHRRLGDQHRRRARRARPPTRHGSTSATRRPATTGSSAASSPPPAATSGSTTPPRAARGTSTAATGTPTFTTQGNNARTAEARTNPLTPGPFGFMPTSLTREYKFPFGERVGDLEVRPDAARWCPAPAPTSRRR